MRRFALATVLVGSGLVSAVPTPAAAAIVLQAGQVDGFALPADPTSPSSTVQALDGTGVLLGGLIDFDVFADDRSVIHTFQFGGLPELTGATLELRVRSGLAGETASDGVGLAFAEPTTATFLDAVVFSRTFGASVEADPLYPSPDPGLLVSHSWGPGDDETFTLDLANLPLAGGGTLNLLPEIDSRGYVDVFVNDDSGVDYMILTATVVPEPSTILIWSLLCVTFGCVGFWRRKK